MKGEETSAYREPGRTIPVLGRYDVAVAGGGPAGCAAAIGAARGGANTVLIEKDGCLGGATVSQGVAVILSTNAADFLGVWHEYIDALKRRRGVLEEQFRWVAPHYHGVVDPEMVPYAWEDLLTQQGVKTLYHSCVIDAVVQDRTIRGVVVATKGGRRAVFADRVIDCTGEGMVAEYAEAPWEQGAAGRKCAMAATKVVCLGNVPAGAGPSTDEELEKLRRDWRAAVDRGEFASPIITSGRILAYVHKNRIGWEMPRHRSELLLVISRILNVDPLDPQAVTRAEREGRAQAWEIADFYRRYVPGCENSFLARVGSHVGIRSTRRIRGLATVTAEDAVNFAKHPDTIARASWEIDIWPPDSYTAPAVDGNSPEVVERRKRLAEGDYFDIPYGCIVAQGADNLLMGGKIISSDAVAQASLRIQQTCMATGEAAGTAAALSLRRGAAPRELDGVEVSRLVQAGWRQREPAFQLIRDAWKGMQDGG